MDHQLLNIRSLRPALLAALCLLTLSPVEARRSHQHQALDVVVSRLVIDNLVNYPSEKRLLLVVTGWGRYLPREKRVIVGPIRPYLEELERQRHDPHYDILADGYYQSRALDKAYPGCVNYIPVYPPTQLPNGNLRITYHRRIGWHPTGNSSFILHRSHGRWRIIAEEGEPLRGKHRIASK